MSRQNIVVSGLSEAHGRMLREGSGISDAVIEERGYRTIEKQAELKRLGFSPQQCLVPALLIPVFNIAGELASYQIRPDHPRLDRQGKLVKYETRAGSRMVLDVNPHARALLRDPSVPLWITEGLKKEDSLISHQCCALGLLGVYGWRGTNEAGGTCSMPEWESIALKHRIVYLVFDSDILSKAAVYAALSRLTRFLELRGADVRVVYLPCGQGGTKLGVDDYLVAGHTIEDVVNLARPELIRPPFAEDRASGPYRATEHGLQYVKQSNDGDPICQPLTNFTAKITSVVLEDDGTECQRRLQLEVCLKGRTYDFVVPNSHFLTMQWATERVGPEAIIYPGELKKQHARCAIQTLSGHIPTRCAFTHLGWRQDEDDNWVYLHAAGAIGSNGTRTDMHAELPAELRRFRLTFAETPEAERQAVLASLRLLELAPLRVILPPYSALWRSVLGASPFSVFLVGTTGVFKTEVTALLQQHFGRELDAQHLPASWLSTGNALQNLAFLAKDAVLTIDDFAPTGSQLDIQKLHHSADVLFRGQGNLAGRQRLRADATLRPVKPPRGLILSTGEDIPRGQSLQARIATIELSRGDVLEDRLSACQRDAATGLYEQATAGFVRWVASRYDDVQEALRHDLPALRGHVGPLNGHQRMPDILAHMAFGLRYFLHYSINIGAVTSQEAEFIWEDGWRALMDMANRQTQHQTSVDPAPRFVRLLQAALTSGDAHVTNCDDGVPSSPGTWGWHQVEADGNGALRAKGTRIGWLDAEEGFLYLQPDAAFAAVQTLGAKMGEQLPLTPRTLWTRLSEKGYLVRERGRDDHLTVRRTFGGRQQSVLAFPLSSLASTPTQCESARPDRAQYGFPPPLWSPLLGALRAQADSKTESDVDHSTMEEINLDTP